MAAALSMLAEDGMFVFPWYNWVLIGLIIVIVVGYKIYQNKMMG